MPGSPTQGPSNVCCNRPAGLCAVAMLRCRDVAQSQRKPSTSETIITIPYSLIHFLFRWFQRP